MSQQAVYIAWGQPQGKAVGMVRGVPTEVDDPHILHKAKSNRFFHVEPTPYDPFLDAPIDPVIEAHELAPPKRSHKKKVVQP